MACGAWPSFSSELVPAAARGREEAIALGWRDRQAESAFANIGKKWFIR